MQHPHQEPTPATNPPSQAAYRQICKRLEQALQDHDLEGFQGAMLQWFNFQPRADFPDPVLACCTRPFTPSRFATLPAPIRLYALQAIFRHHIPRLLDLQPQLDFLRQPVALAGLSQKFQQPFLYLLLAALLLRGETEPAGELFQRHHRKLGGCGLRGWLFFLHGDYTAAIRSFKIDLNRLRRREENPGAFFTGFEGIIMLLSLLAADNHRHLELIRTLTDDLALVQPHNPLLPVYRILNEVTALLESRGGARHLPPTLPPTAGDAVTTLFSGLADLWLTGGLDPAIQPVLAKLDRRASANGYHWLAAGYRSLLQAASPRPLRPATKDQPAAQNSRPAATIPLSWNIGALVKTTEPWRHAVMALQHHDPRPTTKESPRRLAWLLRYREDLDHCGLRPLFQQRRPDGTWSRGRPVALNRLLALTEGNPDSRHRPLPAIDQLPLSPRDQAICHCLARGGSTLSGGFHVLPQPDLHLLVGHPHLYLAGAGHQPLRLEHGQPTLLIEPEPPQNLRLRLHPFPPPTGQTLHRRDETCLQIISSPPALRELAAWLGPEGVSQPRQGSQQLLALLRELPPDLAVFSCLDLQLPHSETMAPNNRVIVQFFPASSGLKVRLRVRPLGPDGPELNPGHGPPLLWAGISGRRYRLRRELAEETDRAQKLAAYCKLDWKRQQSNDPAGPDPATWTLTSPQSCLEFLNRLQEISPPVPQEWPAGRGFSLSPTIELQRLQLKISKKNDWFALNGALQLDDGLVLELSSLLRTTKRGKGRFIPLGHGRFLSLSNELKRKIDEIEAFAELHRGEIRLHPLAVRLLLNAEEPQVPGQRPQVSTDGHWQDFLTRLEQNRTRQDPPPTGLKTRLRHYQLTGYRWLRQMADLQLGACLADDMGLGKTIQALALLLARSNQGPGLVVAPTSLCLNWQAEAHRFAPGLRLIHYSGRNRSQLLTQLGAGDLVVCSYGMLQRDAGVIGAVHWHTIVLDEAQAIKNFLAKRSRAAMQLQGDCKLITTGTPLENHLTELWTLFRFINPGLLGSLEQFRKKFIIPIEQHGDQQARQRLKKLLTPFILRRLKNEVLQELPPRTDITLQVSMHREEAALYEALRRQARATLKNGANRDRPGAPLQVLAEIMKLRRACCHPRLVLPDSTMPGAKLELLTKVVAELLENRHRILVFSQFVDHLAIVRQYLDEQQISYQYFDGATPARVRQQRVRDFQAGRGKLFLISLRAGGLGLNLTAADYVIHLDPWWNPAVEEQASDRAHRIGQDKPVTIYRLITTGTIEEKILAMHQQKRHLAAELLDATRSGPPRSYDELLALLEK
ncbi:DEAD/DEAH box helicase [Desulfurivibrio alkaliphilus]|uniref:SNF2-related protein n=1 Tax=Desulfurivibrio alkaliphilus (strain DSM 19089 / UNIQEM U267 / AHT2) TaxID=589865 RepID=D6Z391_DESAT|nr:DEAD/DEAH box helicase [Desulfurivibrio alkaliphilus]ADH86016.1 SNF2-related protein [Desulfurivibrio alkaliphilus AHT 2]